MKVLTKPNFNYENLKKKQTSQENTNIVSNSKNETSLLNQLNYAAALNKSLIINNHKNVIAFGAVVCNDEKEPSWMESIFSDEVGKSLADGTGAGCSIGLTIDTFTFGTLGGVPTIVGTAVGALGGAACGICDTVGKKLRVRENNLHKAMVKAQLEATSAKTEAMLKEKEAKEAQIAAEAARTKAKMENDKKDQEIAKLTQEIAENKAKEAEQAKKIQQEKEKLQEKLDIRSKFLEQEKAKLQKGFGLGKIAGYQQDIKKIKNWFIYPFVKEEDLKNEGENPKIPNGILFYGPSGNGKTTMAYALAEQVLQDKVKTNFYEIKRPRLQIIEGERIEETKEREAYQIINTLSEIKEKAQKDYEENSQRSIIFMDEFDGYVLNEDKVGSNQPLTSFIKDFMKDCSEYGITIFGATNHPTIMDKAFIINDKRFTMKHLLEPPSKEDIKDILEYYLEGLKDKSVNSDAIAEKLNTDAKKHNRAYSCSGIETLVEKAKALAFEEGRFVSQKDLLDALEEKGSDIPEDELIRFKKDYETIAGKSYEEDTAKK